MKSPIRILALLAVIALFCAPAHALPKQGDMEAGGQLAGWIMTDYDNMVALSGSMGIFYTDEIYVGARVEVGVSDDSAVALVVEGAYNFPVNEVFSPYAGATLGAAYVDVDDDGEIALKTSALGGVKYYLNEYYSIYAEAQLGYFLADESTEFLGIGIGAKMKF